MCPDRHPGTDQPGRQDGMGQGERDNLSQFVSPRQGTAQRWAYNWGPRWSLTSIQDVERHKSSSATGERQDWFSACHQNSAEPLAWQPADLRSPSIVCLIDYFPCNYSRVTLNISLLWEGCKRDRLSEGRLSYCHIGEPLMWIMGRHVLNWSPERAIRGGRCKLIAL